MKPADSFVIVIKLVSNQLEDVPLGIISILQGVTIWFRLLGENSRTGGVNSTPANTARAELHSMITFHHANSRGSRAGRLRIAHLCVPKQLSSTCHVSFAAAPDTDHEHKFSLTHITHLSDDLSNTHKKFHGRVADQYKSHLSQAKSPNSSRPKRSSLKTSSREKLSLTGIFGRILIKYGKD